MRAADRPPPAGVAGIRIGIMRGTQNGGRRKCFLRIGRRKRFQAAHVPNHVYVSAGVRRLIIPAVESAFVIFRRDKLLDRQSGVGQSVRNRGQPGG